MTQVHTNRKERSVVGVSAIEGLPLEIVQLLQVLARIEARRQIKLRASRKDVG